LNIGFLHGFELAFYTWTIVAVSIYLGYKIGRVIKREENQAHEEDTTPSKEPQGGQM